MKTFKMIGDNKELQGQMNTPVENQNSMYDQNSMYENRVLQGDTGQTQSVRNFSVTSSAGNVLL